jgi:hypothetical protein
MAGLVRKILACICTITPDTAYSHRRKTRF